MPFKIIECPRDAMQGIHEFIPTADKVAYIQELLKVGFHTLDVGSFVSPKAIPQMRDTREVLDSLDLSQTNSKLLCIVANQKGADRACEVEQVSYLGFPFSVSETFQQRNTNSGFEEALNRVDYIQNQCQKTGKEMVVYLSMGFGNPYGDPWSPEIVHQWADQMVQRGINILSLSDTIGVSNPQNIREIYSLLSSAYPEVEIGAHLHTRPESWREKIEAAYESGCTRYDGAIKGYGGCPMAADTLTGNMPTEKLLSFLIEHNESPGLNSEAFSDAVLASAKVFH
ncbi:MAG: hydroxymethylglutaryl-CoA lyase [Bacteroidota bacterium]|nr:hydroxymethylglutaryl-CoA lyase [Bacteroidota bacterium]MDX5431778.1 hydroxymethylglutaryl-CoA lyase [Bacteroidota bacterium]MDX5470491.1 hydroxymethylglutaryl-CoA lyase [Bacteroidota bacterium]